MREEFEVWAEGQNVSIMRDGETYYHHTSHHMWYAWQASRSALVVELPNSADGVTDYENKTVAALTAAGITYK